MELNNIFKALDEMLENKDLKIYCLNSEINNLKNKVEELENKLAEKEKTNETV